MKYYVNVKKGGLFAQDEIQVAEMPSLGHLKGYQLSFYLTA